MKLYLSGDERYPYYTLYENNDWVYDPYEIELSDEEYNSYIEATSATEVWQDRLHDMTNKIRRQKMLENTKSGVQPKGFN